MNAPGERRASLPLFFSDPNVAFPLAPRFLPDVRIVELPHGLGVAFHGSPDQTVLQGPNMASVIRYLRNAFACSWNVIEICSRAPAEVGADEVITALRLLHLKGLLVSAPLQEKLADDVVPSSSMVRSLERAFLGRTVNVTGYHAHVESIETAIAAARVLLIGSGLLGIRTLDLLEREGFQHPGALVWRSSIFAQHLNDREQGETVVSCSSVDYLLDDCDPLFKPGLVVVAALRNAPPLLLRAINGLAAERGCTVLFANDTGDLYELGPLVQVPYTGCYECLQIRYGLVTPVAFVEHFLGEAIAFGEDGATDAPEGEALFGAEFAAALLVAEIYRHVTNIAVPALTERVVSADALRGTFATDRFRRVPRCPVCSKAAATGSAFCG